MRVYLFFILSAIFLISLAAACILLVSSANESQVEARTNEMKSQALILANQLAESNYLEESNNYTLDLLIQQAADMWNGRVLIINSFYQVVNDTYVSGEGKYNISELVMRGMGGQSLSTYDPDKQYIEFVQPIVVRETEETGTASDASSASTRVVGVILAMVDATPIQVPVRDLQEKAMLILLIAACIVLPLNLIFSGFLVRPLKRLSQEIERVTEGNLSSKVGGGSYKETRRIGDAFNQTMNRLQVLDQSRQDFVSNVSHELKTPITSIRVLADSLMSMGEAPVELYQEFMEDISAEIDRESKIIDDLLELVRLDKKAQALNISQVNINEMMELMLKRLRPIAQTRNVELLFESFRPITAEIDEVKLSLAITNLVENAIKYNQDAGWVKVSLNADYKYFYVKVSDSGCGIPEDALDHIFERFYRVDKARSRETGGTGLGLSITQNIVQLHHGAIRVCSKEEEGSTFVVRVPLIYIKEER